MSSVVDKFLEAQEPVIIDVLKEIMNGKKETHWMWFVFPQITGLGFSPKAIKYAINNKQEAGEFLENGFLNFNIRVLCETLVRYNKNEKITDILGPIDAVKLRSSMTLFIKCADDNAHFWKVLDTFFSGLLCQFTLEVLDEQINKQINK